MTVVIELAILAIFLIFALTQVVFPLFGWKRFFWIFRSPERKIAEIDSEIEEIEVNKIVAEKEKLKETIMKEGEN